MVWRGREGFGAMAFLVFLLPRSVVCVCVSAMAQVSVLEIFKCGAHENEHNVVLYHKYLNLSQF